MRVMFTVSSWAGHYRAMVPLGWALQAADHEVRVVCAPSEVDTLGGCGMTPVPLINGWSVPMQARIQNHWNVTTGLWPFPQLPPHPLTGQPTTEEFDFDAYMDEHGAQAFEDAYTTSEAVVAFARSWRPDLVVHDLLSIEGTLAARVLDVPSYVHPWGPVGTHEREPGLSLIGADLSGAFARYGVGAADFEASAGFVDPNPPSLAPATRLPRLPVRYVPYNGAGVAPAWVLEPPEKPRVCVVWGNSVTEVYGPCSWAVPTVVSALSTLDVEVVVTLNAADFASLGDVPDSVRAVQNVPVHTFLAHCALVVHHGGGNSVLNGAAVGIPQLAITNGLDQHLIGRRLADTGAGAQLLGHELSVEAVRETAGKLLADEGYRLAAQRLRDEIGQAPTPADLVNTLCGAA